MANMEKNWLNMERMMTSGVIDWHNCRTSAEHREIEGGTTYENVESLKVGGGGFEFDPSVCKSYLGTHFIIFTKMRIV